MTQTSNSRSIKNDIRAIQNQKQENQFPLIEGEDGGEGGEVPFDGGYEFEGGKRWRSRQLAELSNLMGTELKNSLEAELKQMDLEVEVESLDLVMAPKNSKMEAASRWLYVGCIIED